MNLVTSARAALIGSSLLVVVTTASTATATDGALYPGGTPTVSVGAQTTTTALGSGAHQIDIAAANPVLSGRKWSAEWGCTPGSEAAYVYFGALRLNGHSAAGIDVVGNGAILWTLPDTLMPQSPSEGAQYTVGFPSGVCVAAIQLRQSMQVAQHARRYWVDRPVVVYRDLTAPAVALQTLPGGWLNAATSGLTVPWTASDNYGGDGMRQHRVSVAGAVKWSGEPGQGTHQVTVDLAGVPDGQQSVVVTVDGDGTAAGQALAHVLVDRTAPSVASPTVLAGPTVRQVVAGWSVGDPTSGVAASQLEVNTAPDGSVTGQWVPVGPEAAGSGDRGATVDLPGLADGVHAVRVRARDAAGNVGYSGLSALVLDTTAPTVSIQPPPAAPVRALGLTVGLADNLAGAIGLGVTEIDVNTAPDGSASGAWQRLRASLLPPGTSTVQLDFAGLVDGDHLLRVRTANGGDHPELVGEAVAVVRVDQTSPVVSDVAFERVSADALVVRWIGSDARAGVAHATIEWLDGITWRPIVSRPMGGGSQSLTADLTSIPAGHHRLRLMVTDAAGNATLVAGPAGGVAVDHGAPAVTGLRLVGGPPWSLAWTVVDADAAGCIARVAVAGAGTNGWREVATAAAVAGANSVRLPTAELAVGSYRMRLSVCDAVGNVTTVETGGLIVGPAAGPGEARVSAVIRGARVRAVAGLRTTTARVVAGGRLVLTGRLTGVDGRALRGQALVARGSGGEPIGSAVTGAGGTFTMRVRPLRGGTVTVVASSGAIDLPTEQLTRIRVRVTPAITLRASTRSAVALGAPVVLSGRVLPSPAALGRTSTKSIVLEWHDAARGWRPVLNGTLAANGTFRFSWRFQSPAAAVRLRARVPAELGWGLESGVSAPVSVRVR